MDITRLQAAFLANKSGLSVRSREHYQHSFGLFNRFADDERIDLEAPLTHEAMDRFAAWLRDTPVPAWRGSTVRSIYGVHGALKDIKVWVRWLVEYEYLDRAPKVPVPKLPKRRFPILTEEQLHQVFTCPALADGSELAVRNRALISFMLDTGVRLGEVAGLRFDDLDLRERQAVIRGKGNKERLVYFHPDCRDALRLWISYRGEDEGELFWLGAGGVRMVLRKIKEQTGLKQFHAHQLRHTALTMMAKAKMDLHEIKEIAGHASVTTTDAYIAMAGRDIRDKHEAASPLAMISQGLAPIKQRRRRLRRSA
jgi:integrase/recombinase XerC